MQRISRRDWLKLSSSLCTLFGVDGANIGKVAHSLEQMANGEPPVLWLQGLSCSGCSVSLLNSDSPGPAEFLMQYISLRFHSTLSTATGETAMNVVEKTITEGNFILVVEGSLPAKMPLACKMGEKPITELVAHAARNAKAVIAVGTCAAFGGIPAAEGNPTGAMSVAHFLKERRMVTPVIHLPGCPCHPDWLVGTVAHVVNFGLPPLDSEGRPKMFYQKLIHDQCPRFADYEREYYAQSFSEEGCLFMLGCQGPITKADCTLRNWNSGTNTCIRAGAPCIGCASAHFAAKKNFSFYMQGVQMVEEGES